jgi:hypothetical protein
MSTDRQLISAQLTGVAWGARWHAPDEAETAAAVSELREILAGRQDGPALAEVAGLALGFHEGGLSEPRARAAAHFCREAGADPELIRQVLLGQGQPRPASVSRNAPTGLLVNISMVHLHRSLAPSGFPRYLHSAFFGETYRYRPDLAEANRADLELVLPALGLPAAH